MVNFHAITLFMKVPVRISLLILVLIIRVQVVAQDSVPRLLDPLKYKIPEAAIDAEIDGTIVVSVKVDKLGKPSNPQLAISPIWPCGKTPKKELQELSETLEKTVLQARYAPATEKGSPISKNLALWITLQNPKLEKEFGESPMLVSDLPKRSTHLPAPSYTGDPKGGRDQGMIVVTVITDLKGNVIRAGKTSGSKVLQEVARKTACQSKFSPMIIDGKPVRMIGTLNYMFF